MSANSFFLSFYYINLVQTLRRYKLFLILQSKYIPLGVVSLYFYAK